MQGLSIVSLIVAAALIIFGIVTIIRKKAPGANPEKYTQASIEDFSVKFGLLNIGFGIGFFMIFEGMTGSLLGHIVPKMTFYGDILIIVLVFVQMAFVKPALKEKPKKTKKAKIVHNKKKK